MSRPGDGARSEGVIYRTVMGVSGERGERGQSLVEVAIFLPILLIILAGIVEVSHALTTYLVIANAAREGARFGAAGGKDEDITTVILTSTKLDLAPERADVYVIHARLNPAGELEKWKESHTYGSGPEASGFTAERVKEWMGTGGGPVSVELLVTVFDYDLQSLLGLPGLSAFSDRISLRAHSVMRVGGGVPRVAITPTKGCAVFPIALPARAVKSADRGEILGPLENGTGEGQFGWLRWQEHQATNTALLAAALAWPGNSQDPHKGYKGGQGVHVGDGVWDSNNLVGSKHLVTDILADYRDRGVYLRVIVWDGYEGGRYKVAGFAIVNPVDFSDDLASLSVQFSHTDESCGQR